jgi:hypothetical protein
MLVDEPAPVGLGGDAAVEILVEGEPSGVVGVSIQSHAAEA